MTSSSTTRTSERGLSTRIFAAISLPASTLRTPIQMVCPEAARRRQVSAPSPPVAPVTRTVDPCCVVMPPLSSLDPLGTRTGRSWDRQYYPCGAQGCHAGGMAIDRTELAAALRHARQRITPGEVGLPSGSHRRTPGLRREEVAMLAGISVDYVVRLEQGRGPVPSAQVLGAWPGRCDSTSTVVISCSTWQGSRLPARARSTCTCGRAYCA